MNKEEIIEYIKHHIPIIIQFDKITPNGIKQAIDDLLEENEELKERTNKAIEYITKQMKKYNGYDKDFENILSNTIVILGDKER